MTQKAPAPDAHPVDIRVGRRIRQMRLLKGISQMDLANGIGVSFQQLQKYECANNRVSASRLVEIAAVLDVDPAYFLQKDETLKDHGLLSLAPELDNDVLKLIRTFAKIKGKDQRESILSLVKTIAEAG